MSDRRPSPPRDPSRKRAARPTPRRGGGWVAALAGFGLSALVGGAIVWGAGCDDDAEIADTDQAPGRARTSAPRAGASSAPGASAEPPPSASAKAAPAPTTAPVDLDRWEGPWLGAMAMQTPVYPEPRFSDERLGYLRQGAKVPVEGKPIQRANCKQGWHKLAQGGYVCGKYASTNVDNPRIKLGVRAPDLEAILPYQYAYNRFHGTPLYRKPPTREEMERFEPHIAEERAKKAKKAAEKEAQRAADKEAKKTEETRAEGGSGASPPAASPTAAASADEGDAGRRGRRAKREATPPTDEGRPSAEGSAVPTGDDAAAAMEAVAQLDAGPPEEGEPPPEKPWWQVANETGDKPSVTLADMTRDAGGSLEKRMAKGFFVAIDKTVGWNGRSFFRTTNGLLAPTDRMWINKPPEVKGIDFPEDAKAVFFVLSDKGRVWALEERGDKKTPKDRGAAARFSARGLTGRTETVDGTEYREVLGGLWVKSAHGTWTEPGARPDAVKGDERWIDVNLDRRTLVLFEGERAVYAALVSPGKRSRDKRKNHATKPGVFRIREKHVAVTMDGDGAGGDLPYSIDDVPYVAYYDGSYALHGAFWHGNFGREMSHGCVNLAPHDAKRVFSFAEPAVPRGWHAVYATKDRPGSVVSIH